eukprot:11968697-Karenia_brevis.AAC.1
MEAAAPWRDPRLPVSKSAAKERPRRRKGKKGRGKGKKGKDEDDVVDLSPLTKDYGNWKNLKIKKLEEKKKN